MPMLLLPMLLGVEQLGTALGIFDVGLRGYYHVDVPAGEPALQVLVHLLQEIDCLLPGQRDLLATHHCFVLLVVHYFLVVTNPLFQVLVTQAYQLYAPFMVSDAFLQFEIHQLTPVLEDFQHLVYFGAFFSHFSYTFYTFSGLWLNLQLFLWFHLLHYLFWPLFYLIGLIQWPFCHILQLPKCIIRLIIFNFRLCNVNVSSSNPISLLHDRVYNGHNYFIQSFPMKTLNSFIHSVQLLLVLLEIFTLTRKCSIFTRIVNIGEQPFLLQLLDIILQAQEPMLEFLDLLLVSHHDILKEKMFQLFDIRSQTNLKGKLLIRFQYIIVHLPQRVIDCFQFLVCDVGVILVKEQKFYNIGDVVL